MVPADVLVWEILSSPVPPPRTPHGTAQPADPLHFTRPLEHMTRFMCWVLSGSLSGGQDSGSTKFVQQIDWENDKNGHENEELKDREPDG